MERYQRTSDSGSRGDVCAGTPYKNRIPGLLIVVSCFMLIWTSLVVYGLVGNIMQIVQYDSGTVAEATVDGVKFHQSKTEKPSYYYTTFSYTDAEGVVYIGNLSAKEKYKTEEKAKEQVGSTVKIVINNGKVIALDGERPGFTWLILLFFAVGFVPLCYCLGSIIIDAFKTAAEKKAWLRGDDDEVEVVDRTGRILNALKFCSLKIKIYTNKGEKKIKTARKYLYGAADHFIKQGLVRACRLGNAVALYSGESALVKDDTLRYKTVKEKNYILSRGVVAEHCDLFLAVSSIALVLGLALLVGVFVAKAAIFSIATVPFIMFGLPFFILSLKAKLNEKYRSKSIDSAQRVIKSRYGPADGTSETAQRFSVAEMEGWVNTKLNADAPAVADDGEETEAQRNARYAREKAVRLGYRAETMQKMKTEKKPSMKGIYCTPPGFRVAAWKTIELETDSKDGFTIWEKHCKIGQKLLMEYSKREKGSPKITIHELDPYQQDLVGRRITSLYLDSREKDSDPLTKDVFGGMYGDYFELRGSLIKTEGAGNSLKLWFNLNVPIFEPDNAAARFEKPPSILDEYLVIEKERRENDDKKTNAQIEKSQKIRAEYRRQLIADRDLFLLTDKPLVRGLYATPKGCAVAAKKTVGAFIELDEFDLKVMTPVEEGQELCFEYIKPTRYGAALDVATVSDTPSDSYACDAEDYYEEYIGGLFMDDEENADAVAQIFGAMSGDYFLLYGRFVKQEQKGDGARFYFEVDVPVFEKAV